MEPSLRNGERVWLNKAVYFRYDTGGLADYLAIKAPARRSTSPTPLSVATSSSSTRRYPATNRTSSG